MAGGLAAGGTLVLSGERPSAHFGASGDFIGDLNGDGFDDVAIGAPGDNLNGEKAGTVYLYFGSAVGLANRPDALLVGGAGDAFGSSVAGLGDVNGDGFDDFAIGAEGASRRAYPNQPAVFVFMGSAMGIHGVRFSETAEIVTVGPSFGSAAREAPSISSAGDLDQNGALDLAIGLPSLDLVYVFLNGTIFPNATFFSFSDADVTWIGTSGDRFGEAISAVGDVNAQNAGAAHPRFGDDFLIGAPGRSGGSGGAYLVLGSQGLPRGERSIAFDATIFEGGVGEGEFGAAVSGAGDLDQDGVGDIAVGAPGDGEGRVTVYFGFPITGPATVSPTTFRGETSRDRFGSSLSAPLPLAVIGANTIAVGAPLNDFGGSGAGSAYLLSGLVFGGDVSPRGAEASAASADRVIRNPLAGVGDSLTFGNFVRAGSDINGDGSGDLLVGIPQASTAGDESGGAMVLW